MLTLTSNENQSKCFKFIGADSNQKHTTHLISNNTSLLAPSDSDGDTCSFYSGPSDATIMAFGESTESCGSIAYAGGSEGGFTSSVSGSCFSAASSCGSFSGGGCSYSC